MTKKASDRMKKAIGKAQKKRWAEYRAGKRTWKINGVERRYGKPAEPPPAPPAKSQNVVIENDQVLTLPVGSRVNIVTDAGCAVAVRAVEDGLEILRNGRAMALSVERVRFLTVEA